MRTANRMKYGLKVGIYSNQEYDMKYLEANKGAEGPTLIFLHGLGASKDQWGPAIYRLANHFHCIFIDLPGEGESSFDVSMNYSPQAQAARVRKFMQSKNITDGVVIGSSNGGCVAILLAVDNNDNVSKVIAISPAGLRATELSNTMKQFLETGEHPFGYRTVEEMLSFWRIVFDNPPEIPAFIAQARAERGRQRFHKVDKIVNDFREAGIFLLENKISRIRANTLVIWGKKDQVFDVSCTQNLARELPHAKVHIIDDAGHLPYLESGSEVFNSMMAFCNEDQRLEH